MNDVVTKIQNRVWRLKGYTPTALSEFLLKLENVDPADYSGRSAELFFGNDEQTVYKWLHYLAIYDRIFGKYQGQPIRFLEIGVCWGGSMNLWRKFFGEAATIFGIDINPECASFNGISGQVRIGSQDDPGFLRSVVEEMGGVDIVLDDGSHVARHQRASFETLFPLVSDGGLYVIEDLHTAYWADFEGGVGRPGTAIELLKEKVDAMHRHYHVDGVNTSERIPQIESIQFFDSIAVVEKRIQQPRGCVMVPDRGIA